VSDKSYDVYLREEKHITYHSLSSKYTVARASRRCRGTVFTVYCVRSTALSCLQGQTGTYCEGIAAEVEEVRWELTKLTRVCGKLINLPESESQTVFSNGRTRATGKRCSSTCLATITEVMRC
jgi:hypothetical protein